MMDITTMRPMERHRYITSNTKVCPCCQNEKKLSLFWIKETNEIKDKCKACLKKEETLEVLNIVLKVAKQEGAI